MHRMANEIFFEEENELCHFFEENIFLTVAAIGLVCQETAQYDFELMEEEDCAIVDGMVVVICFELSALSSWWEEYMNLSHLFFDHLDHGGLKDSIDHFLARAWVCTGHHLSGHQVDSSHQHRNTRHSDGHLGLEEDHDL